MLNDGTTGTVVPRPVTTKLLPYAAAPRVIGLERSPLQLAITEFSTPPKYQSRQTRAELRVKVGCTQLLLGENERARVLAQLLLVSSRQNWLVKGQQKNGWFTASEREYWPAERGCWRRTRTCAPVTEHSPEYSTIWPKAVREQPNELVCRVWLYQVRKLSLRTEPVESETPAGTTKSMLQTEAVPWQSDVDLAAIISTRGKPVVLKIVLAVDQGTYPVWRTTPAESTLNLNYDSEQSIGCEMPSTNKIDPCRYFTTRVRPSSDTWQKTGLPRLSKQLTAPSPTGQRRGKVRVSRWLGNRALPKVKLSLVRLPLVAYCLELDSVCEVLGAGRKAGRLSVAERRVLWSEASRLAMTGVGELEEGTTKLLQSIFSTREVLYELYFGVMVTAVRAEQSKVSTQYRGKPAAVALQKVKLPRLALSVCSSPRLTVRLQPLRSGWLVRVRLNPKALTACLQPTLKQSPEVVRAEGPAQPTGLGVTGTEVVEHTRSLAPTVRVFASEQMLMEWVKEAGTEVDTPQTRRVRLVPAAMTSGIVRVKVIVVEEKVREQATLLSSCQSLQAQHPPSSELQVKGKEVDCSTTWVSQFRGTGSTMLQPIVPITMLLPRTGGVTVVIVVTAALGLLFELMAARTPWFEQAAKAGSNLPHFVGSTVFVSVRVTLDTVPERQSQKVPQQYCREELVLAYCRYWHVPWLQPAIVAVPPCKQSKGAKKDSPEPTWLAELSVRALPQLRLTVKEVVLRAVLMPKVRPVWGVNCREQPPGLALEYCAPRALPAASQQTRQKSVLARPAGRTVNMKTSVVEVRGKDTAEGKVQSAERLAAEPVFAVQVELQQTRLVIAFRGQKVSPELKTSQAETAVKRLEVPLTLSMVGTELPVSPPLAVLQQLTKENESPREESEGLSPTWHRQKPLRVWLQVGPKTESMAAMQMSHSEPLKETPERPMRLFWIWLGPVLLTLVTLIRVQELEDELTVWQLAVAASGLPTAVRQLTEGAAELQVTLLGAKICKPHLQRMRPVLTTLVRGPGSLICRILSVVDTPLRVGLDTVPEDELMTTLDCGDPQRAELIESTLAALVGELDRMGLPYPETRSEAGRQAAAKKRSENWVRQFMKSRFWLTTKKSVSPTAPYAEAGRLLKQTPLVPEQVGKSCAAAIMFCAKKVLKQLKKAGSLPITYTPGWVEIWARSLSLLPTQNDRSLAETVLQGRIDNFPKEVVEQLDMNTSQGSAARSEREQVVPASSCPTPVQAMLLEEGSEANCSTQATALLGKAGRLCLMLRSEIEAEDSRLRQRTTLSYRVARVEADILKSTSILFMGDSAEVESLRTRQGWLGRSGSGWNPFIFTLCRTVCS